MEEQQFGYRILLVTVEMQRRVAQCSVRVVDCRTGKVICRVSRWFGLVCFTVVAIKQSINSINQWLSIHMSCQKSMSM